MTTADVTIRTAEDSDTAGVRDTMVAIYGEHYAHPEFYDLKFLKQMILGENAEMLVAEDRASGKVIGIAAVILEVGAFSDLVGEFGRLGVMPEWRGRGVGGLLMTERLRRVRDRLHVGIVDARVTHPYSLRIAQKHGFVSVGFCPLRHRFDVRESTGVLAQWFGDALALRRNNPRIISEVHPLASAALTNAGLPIDAIVDDTANPFPHDSDFDLEQLATTGYADLLRIERGRTRHRKVYGPMRLHYGYFKLQAGHASYLLARRDGRIVGAVGYIHDENDRSVRIFELITLDDQAVCFLLMEVERQCRESWGVEYIEIDVAADAPRMQRTLIEIGFVPAIYVPAMAFHDVERLDLVRLVRLLVPLDLSQCNLTPEMQAIADLVAAPIYEQQTVARVTPALRQSGLFRGLTDEQITRLAGHGRIDRREIGDTVITAGDVGDTLHLVLSGAVDIFLPGREAPVGAVEPGEAIGEMGLLADTPHKATAITSAATQLLTFRYQDLVKLIRRRPDIGLVIYRNLAEGLGRKLRRATSDRRQRWPGAPRREE